MAGPQKGNRVREKLGPQSLGAWVLVKAGWRRLALRLVTDDLLVRLDLSLGLAIVHETAECLEFCGG